MAFEKKGFSKPFVKKDGAKKDFSKGISFDRSSKKEFAKKDFKDGDKKPRFEGGKRTEFKKRFDKTI